MDISNPLGTTVPILFLVILKLCDVAREASIGLFDNDSVGEFELSLSNQYTTLAFIHLVNYGILVFLFVGTTTATNVNVLDVISAGKTASVEVLLSVITLLLWLLLPILEAKNFNLRSPNDSAIRPSLRAYWAGTLVIATAIGVNAYIEQKYLSGLYEIPITDLTGRIKWMVDNIAITFVSRLLFIVVIGVGLYISTKLAWRRLHNEYDKTDSQTPPYIQ